MTTAHRPTFDPAKGKDSLSGPAYHQRLQPAHKTLKHRQTGQGNTAETKARDLRAELVAAEAAHFASKNKGGDGASEKDSSARLALPDAVAAESSLGEGDEDETRRRRRLVLAEAADLDADLESDGDDAGSAGGSGSSDDDEDSDDSDDSDDDDDDEDPQAALMRELDAIKRERAEKAAKEEAARAEAEAADRMTDIAKGNPLLGQPSSADFGVKRRWDDDVVFRNQARGVAERDKSREFVNDLLRSDFHKRFMNKYVR